MRALARTRPAVLVLLGVLVVLGVAGVGYAASTKPDFTVGVSPASQSIQQGQTATYTVTASGSGGFAGAVAWSVSGLPTGATGTYTPTSTSLTSAAPSATSTLAVATAKATPTGTYSLTITGTSGNTKRTVSAGLTLTYALNGSFSVTASPSTVSVAPGSTAVYTVGVTRSGGFTGAVGLAPYGTWPAGTTPAFNPSSVPSTGSSSALQVSTASTTPDGTYTIYVVGSAKDPGSGQTTYQYAQAQLVVDSKLSAKPFSVGGGTPAKPLAPGVDNQPLDLTISNPNNQPIQVTNLSVTVSGTSRATCAPGNFQVTQYGGAYPLTVPAGATAARLSTLGIATNRMPQLKMLDLPQNQDACKGVTVNLSYSGSATGN